MFASPETEQRNIIIIFVLLQNTPTMSFYNPTNLVKPYNNRANVNNDKQSYYIILNENFNFLAHIKYYVCVLIVFKATKKL